MKVILNQTVPKVGKAGTVVTVADGYARNFLFPRGLAIVADRRQIAALEGTQARLAQKTAGQKTEAESLKAKLDGGKVRIEGRLGGDNVRLIGAITSERVADAINAAYGTKIDRKQVALVEPIKRLGEYEVELDLHMSVDARLKVEVYDPKAIVTEEADEAEPALA